MTVNIQPKEHEILNFLTARLGVSEEKIVENALTQYLYDLQDDFSDFVDAEKIAADIACGKMRTHTESEVRAELGL